MTNYSSLYYICGALYNKSFASLSIESREEGKIRPRTQIVVFSQINYLYRMVEYYYGGKPLKTGGWKINESDAPRFLRDVSVCSVYSEYLTALADFIDYKAVQTSQSRQAFHKKEVPRINSLKIPKPLPTIPEKYEKDFLAGFLDENLKIRLSKTQFYTGHVRILGVDDFISSLFLKYNVSFPITSMDASAISTLLTLEPFTRASKYGLALLYEKISESLYAGVYLGKQTLDEFLGQIPKRCNRCEKFFPDHYFHGKYECKPCVRERNNIKYSKNKKPRVFKTRLHKNGFSKMCASQRKRIKDNGGAGAWWRDCLGMSSLKDFKEYIESQFSGEMSWHNYGSVWQLDHIKPCAAFYFSSKESFYECFHYSNVRPLLSEENHLKSDSFNGSSVRLIKNEILGKTKERFKNTTILS